MAKNKKDQLGKGLRSLISNIGTPVEEAKIETVKKISGSTSYLAIEQIEVNPFQPRTEFDQDKLLELVQSIKANGLIQPITVRKLSDKAFQIISGERRFRASKLAKLKEVPCFVLEVKDDKMLELALIENIQRADLNPFEIASSYKRLIDALHYSQDELALRVGKKRSTVSNYLRLLKLLPVIQKSLKNDEISMGHAKALMSIENPDQRLFVFQRILDENLSVRETESISKQYKAGHKTTNQSSPVIQTASPQIKSIQDKISGELGTKVSIKRNAEGKGQIIIQFSSDNMFNDIIEYFD